MVLSLKAAPGTWWNNTSGNTILLSRIIRDNADGEGQCCRIAHGIPANAFFARGANGRDDMDVVARLLPDVIASPSS